jgi:hypothetical protein
MMTTSKRYGLFGALTVPLVLGALVIIRCMLPFDSVMYSALHKVFWIPTIPLFWLMEKLMEGCGIHGEEGMRFLLPMFLTMLAYWAALGFAIGFLMGHIKTRLEAQPRPEPYRCPARTRVNVGLGRTLDTRIG